MVRESIERPSAVRCQHTDLEGRFVDEIYDGWTARVIQHEYEHLTGKLLVDHMLPAARKMLLHQFQRRAVKRAERAASRQRSRSLSPA